MFKADGVSRIEGLDLSLRLIEASDADYLYSLRTNEKYNGHLSAVQGGVDDQRNWINAYKERESGSTELYYIIERADGIPCGTVRLYDINSGSFEWGSWILDENKPRKAALESALLVYHLAFDILKLEKACFDVRRDNLKTLDFHRRFGAVETHSNAVDFFFYFEKTQFDLVQQKLWSVLTGPRKD